MIRFVTSYLTTTCENVGRWTGWDPPLPHPGEVLSYCDHKDEPSLLVDLAKRSAKNSVSSLWDCPGCTQQALCALSFNTHTHTHRGFIKISQLKVFTEVKYLRTRPFWRQEGMSAGFGYQDKPREVWEWRLVVRKRMRKRSCTWNVVAREAEGNGIVGQVELFQITWSGGGMLARLSKPVEHMAPRARPVCPQHRGWQWCAPVVTNVPPWDQVSREGSEVQIGY